MKGKGGEGKGRESVRIYLRILTRLSSGPKIEVKRGVVAPVEGIAVSPVGQVSSQWVIGLGPVRRQEQRAQAVRVHVFVHRVVMQSDPATDFVVHLRENKIVFRLVMNGGQIGAPGPIGGVWVNGAANGACFVPGLLLVTRGDVVARIP